MFMSRLPLKGKTTLITGASGGIGKAISKRFAGLGSFVYLCGRNYERLERLKIEINEGHLEERAEVAQCDISNREEVVELYERIKGEHNGLDILINNAAVQGPPPPHDTHFPGMTIDNFKKTVAIDLSGAAYFTLLSLPYMKKNGYGRVIFTAAPFSSSGIPSPYLAGKIGFLGLSNYIAKKYKDDGIFSFALALRHVDTPMIRRVLKSRGKDIEEGIKKMHAASLTGRMINPEEIAELYSFFALNRSPKLSGVTLLADGGITFMR